MSRVNLNELVKHMIQDQNNFIKKQKKNINLIKIQVKKTLL